MNAEKNMIKERDLEFLKAPRVDSSPNTIPSEAFRNDLQKLSTNKYMA
jgi:hypothetical protein